VAAVAEKQEKSLAEQPCYQAQTVLVAELLSRQMLAAAAVEQPKLVKTLLPAQVALVAQAPK
jgi:hypothetical protein